MSKSDGSITFVTALDNKQLEKDLQRLNKKISGLESKIKTTERQRMPLLEQSKELSGHLDKAKAKLDAMKNAAVGSFSKEQIAEQAETVQALQTRWNEIQSEVEKYDNVIKNSTLKLDEAKETAGQLAQELAEAAANSRLMDDVVEDVGKRMDHFKLRFKEVVRSALVFTLITQALSKFRDWMGKVIRTNDEATAAIARLKGALLTLAQPLVEVIIPVFTTLVNILARVISIVAQLVSFLFGKTAKQSSAAAEALNEETEALEGVGSAAEDAAGSLAGFDEINTINTEASGGGGAGSSVIEPDFSGLELDLLEDASALINGLKEALAGLFTLDFNRMFGGLAEAVSGLRGIVDAALDKVKVSILSFLDWVDEKTGGKYHALIERVTQFVSDFIDGIKLAVDGLLEFVEGVFSGNVEKIVGGISNIFSGLKAVVSATTDFLRDLLLSFLNWLDEKTNGNLSEMIDSLKKLVTNAFDGIKENLNGFLDFLASVFAGDIEGALSGIENMFDGFKKFIFAIFDTIIDALGPKLTNSIQLLRDLIGSTIDTIKTIFSGLVEFLGGVFAGDMDKAARGLANIVIGIVNGLIFALRDAINWVIRALNNLFNFKVPNWVPGIGGSSWSLNMPQVSWQGIPRLATGAVIPPNREFLAVLGDQTSGNNIEAPESLIRKIVREEAGGMNTELLEAILEAIRAGQVIKVGERVFGETAVRAINNVTRSAGKSVLLV